MGTKRCCWAGWRDWQRDAVEGQLVPFSKTSAVRRYRDVISFLRSLVLEVHSIYLCGKKGNGDRSPAVSQCAQNPSQGKPFCTVEVAFLLGHSTGTNNELRTTSSTTIVHRTRWDQPP